MNLRSAYLLVTKAKMFFSSILAASKTHCWFSFRPLSRAPSQAFSCLLALALTSPFAMAETLTLAGTGAGLGTMQLLAAGFAKVAPAVAVVVLPNMGSSGGMKALGAGVIDLAVTSRPLKVEEVAQGFTAVEYGKTPFVFVTRMPGAGGFRSLSELVEVYAGERPVWPDGSPIRLIMRPRNDGDSALLEAISPAMKQAVQTALARPGIMVRSTDQDAADAIESIPGALGATSLALVIAEGRKLSLLPVNGIHPSPQTIADGRYPYFKTMFLVRKPGANELVSRFIAFVDSPPGRQILSKSGHWVTSRQ